MIPPLGSNGLVTSHLLLLWMPTPVGAPSTTAAPALLLLPTGWRTLTRESNIRNSELVPIEHRDAVRNELPPLGIRIACWRCAAPGWVLHVLLDSQVLISRQVQATRMGPDVEMSAARIFEAELLGVRGIRVELLQNCAWTGACSLNVQPNLRRDIDKVVGDEGQEGARAQLVADDRGQIVGRRVSVAEVWRVLVHEASGDRLENRGVVEVQAVREICRREWPRRPRIASASASVDDTDTIVAEDSAPRTHGDTTKAGTRTP